MRVISVIENEEVIRKILKHLGLWDKKARPPPKPVPAKTPEFHIDYSDCQLPLSDAYLYVDPEYLSEA
jgi:predicted Zn-dependent peptidase